MKLRNALTCTVTAFMMIVLSGCNSSENTLGVTKSDLPPAQGGATGAPGTDPAAAPVPGNTPTTGTAPAATGTAMPTGVSQTAKLRFAPIVGAPIAAATPLSQRLSALAKQKGIVLGTAGDTDNTHIMKGYFSALPDGNLTTIIYVWDILDPAGTRLHRIQGQEKVPGGAADPWSSVPAATMEGIADKAIGGYLSWVSGSKT
ncbi:hypothetical protein QFZ34_001769 [Phyllobacterium ifriqiyense]|uniref:Lipoprotein n=1 Tax=Phyllobacterium ifriqiyense TaxID=314238 RepID=A0ABU0S773_9HYPH|nr:hypothetical protein [Phyllobacterium ifriqiyense]MDQ0996587.1 hypothetical protein [Phyllobacterium ifriqiyense]